jgi:hypothetical protein
MEGRRIFIRPSISGRVADTFARAAWRETRKVADLIEALDDFNVEMRKPLQALSQILVL